VNLTTNAFLAVGRDDHNAIAQRSTDILAYLVAAEGSMDFDWYRLKLFAYHSSGDDDPLDGDANGFDAIFEDPNFAGADTSFFQRQPIPLVGGGGVVLSGRNALLPALRSSKEEGQSNFVNPGLLLLGAGGDFDLMPSVRLSFDASWLDFVDTAVCVSCASSRRSTTTSDTICRPPCCGGRCSSRTSSFDCPARCSCRGPGSMTCTRTATRRCTPCCSTRC
jgi:hypothetical protein